MGLVGKWWWWLCRLWRCEGGGVLESKWWRVDGEDVGVGGV